MASVIEVQIEIDAELMKYIDDAKAEAHEFSWTGRPLPETVKELYELVKKYQGILDDLAYAQP